jgi:hypothetical protein
MSQAVAFPPQIAPPEKQKSTLVHWPKEIIAFSLQVQIGALKTEVVWLEQLSNWFYW